jgi:hypothetical protein
VKTSVTEPHHFYAAPAPGENFDAAPAPTLPYSKAKFLKRTKVYTHIETSVVDPDPHGSRSFCRIRIRNSRFRIRIQVIVQNWMEKCIKTIKKLIDFVIFTVIKYKF